MGRAVEQGGEFVIRQPIIDVRTGDILRGESFVQRDGRLAFHECHDQCDGGIIIGQISKTGASVVHWTPGEALAIGEALCALARGAMA